jgi:hypothetical protein
MAKKMFTRSQLNVLKWVGIVTIGGVVVYKLGSKFGLFGNGKPSPPNPELDTPEGYQYTHTSGFDAQALINAIVQDWTPFGGDVFAVVFSQIKSAVQTQGDWQTFNNTFLSEKGVGALDYITSWLQHAPWAVVTNNEEAQIVSYINNLPL